MPFSDDPPEVKQKKIVRAFALLTLLFFLILFGFAWLVIDVRNLSSDTKNLATENAQRIQDIQISRVQSCKHTYDGVYEVFYKNFVPDDPLTPEQQVRLDKFDKTIDDLKQGCIRQTSTKKAANLGDKKSRGD